MNIIINQILQSNVQSFINNMPQALLISGPFGSGKKFIAEYILYSLKNNEPNLLIFKIEPEKDKVTIGIEQIKQLKLMFRTKNTNTRIVYMPDAEKMTEPAQNTILKLLEEPPKNVHFIFTSSAPSKLLITVRSRLSELKYIRPSNDQFTDYAKEKGITGSEIARYIEISGGRAALFVSLCSHNTDYSILKNIDFAKDILSEPVRDRLLRVDQLVSKKDTTINEVLDALSLVCNAALKGTAKKSGAFKPWLDRLKTVENAKIQLEKNVLPKLVLTKLFLVL